MATNDNVSCKKSWRAVLSSIAALLLINTAFAQSPLVVKNTTSLPYQYRRYDTNRDNQIGLYEWPSGRIAEFEQFDKNNDGFATPSELVTATSKHQSPNILPSKYKGLDKNGDGQIGLYEWAPDRYNEFARLDSNNDGFLLPSELGVPAPIVNVQIDRKKKQVEERFVSRAGGVFRLVDQDHNGVLSRSEWAKVKNFTRKINVDEIRPRFPLSREAFAQIYLDANPPVGSDADLE